MHLRSYWLCSGNRLAFEICWGTEAMSNALENLRRAQERGELSREAVEGYTQLFKLALDIHKGDEEAAKRDVRAWLDKQRLAAKACDFPPRPPAPESVKVLQAIAGAIVGGLAGCAISALIASFVHIFFAMGATHVRVPVKGVLLFLLAPIAGIVVGAVAAWSFDLRDWKDRQRPHRTAEDFAAKWTAAERREGSNEPKRLSVEKAIDNHRAGGNLSDAQAETLHAKFQQFLSENGGDGRVARLALIKWTEAEARRLRDARRAPAPGAPTLNPVASYDTTTGSPTQAKRTFGVRVGQGRHGPTFDLAPGESIRDIAIGPEMVLLPPGKLQMGSLFWKDWGDLGDSYGEGPCHNVTIGYAFLVAKCPLTFDEWDAAQPHPDWERYSTIRPSSPADNGWGRGRRPVINVSWNDAQAYVAWLSKTTGMVYRLLTEAEWEYACRAGSRTEYCFDEDHELLDDYGWFLDNSGYMTHPVGEKAPNSFGLHDMHGNVFEWCEDAWSHNYAGAPTDGSPRKGPSSSLRVCRGGAFATKHDMLRSASRKGMRPDYRGFMGGFRVARAIAP